MGGQGAGVGGDRVVGSPSVWLLSLEAALGAIFVSVGNPRVRPPSARLPPGSRIVEWSRWAWAVLFGIGLLAFINTVLQPGTGTSPTPGVVADHGGHRLLITGVASVTFWPTSASGRRECEKNSPTGWISLWVEAGSNSRIQTGAERSGAGEGEELLGLVAARDWQDVGVEEADLYEDGRLIQ